MSERANAEAQRFNGAPGPTATDEARTGGARARRRELPPLRWLRSLAVPVSALMGLVILASAVSGLLILGQLRDLRERFDLLTGVYIPLQERLSVAAVHSARVGAQVQVSVSEGGPSPTLRSTDLLLFAEALAERESLVEAARAPLDQALENLERLGGERVSPALVALADKLGELERAVAVPVDIEPARILQDSRRQLEINRLFRELAQETSTAVLRQRQDVADAGRRVESLTIGVTLAAAGLALLAAIAVVLTLRPLRRLSVGVRLLADGDWEQRIPLAATDARSDDEVTRLAREFNAMAEALKERERELIQGERLAAVGQLAAQITHEIRNPLASLALNAELLVDELEAESAEGRRLVARITSEVDRLTGITEDYLSLVRRPPGGLQPLDLVHELGELVDFVADEYARAGTPVRLIADVQEALVRGDPGRLRQLFLNLLRNAKDATAGARSSDTTETSAPPPKPAEITMRVALSEGEIRVEVSDHGPGIGLPADELHRIFEPFYSRKSGGTGLGLSTVQQIAQDHGGTVRVERTGVAGTCIAVLLPALETR